MFPHQKLRAWKSALAFYRYVLSLRKRVPGAGPTFDQLYRASGSACLNIAEGASAWSFPQKRRYFQIAMASLGEAAAGLTLLALEGGFEPEEAWVDLENARRNLAGLIKRLR